MCAPLVSISCITYNHAAYIKTALDSFLSQNCPFTYEILIHDDASSDGTADIIRDYASRYPDIIRPILQTENQYQKGIRNVSGVFNFPRARGKYIAMCEGDDFWCSKEKLQMQAAYMEAHPETALCCHAAKIAALDGAFREHAEIHPFHKDGVLSAEEVIAKPVNFPTASLFFRTDAVKNLPDWYFRCPVGDIPLQLLLLLHGGVYYFDKALSVYRIGGTGSWGESMESGSEAARKAKWNAHLDAMMSLYQAFDSETCGIYQQAVQKAKARCRFQVDLKCGSLQALEQEENKEFVKELPVMQRNLLLLSYRHPKAYQLLRKSWQAVCRKKA